MCALVVFGVVTESGVCTAGLYGAVCALVVFGVVTESGVGAEMRRTEEEGRIDR